MFNVLSLFDGMSCGQLALKKAGIHVTNYYASEIDKHAIKVTNDNFPNTIQVGDVTELRGWYDLPKIDLLIGGSPCQGFSFCGSRLNFDDPRSKLFFEFVRIKDEVNPKYFLLENVRMKQEYQDIISEYLGVEPVVINSNLVSAQNRHRLYWTNIPFDGLPEDKNISLESILEHGSKPEVLHTPRGFRKGGIQKDNTKSPTLTANSWEHNNHLTFDGGLTKRKFTPIECERLQTVPDGYTSCVSDSQRYKMLGNGWTVDVVKHILKGLDNACKRC